MPRSIVFTIRPLTEARVPALLGRAAHAAVLRLIADVDPSLAAQIHDDDGPKPLTVSHVLGLDARNHAALVRPDGRYHLRVTLLTPALETLATAWQPATLPLLDLDGVMWCVEQMTADPGGHPWAGSATYETLAHAVLTRSVAPTRWTFEFVAPVTFRQRGLTQPLPTPALIFGSLLDKWNAFAPLAFPEEVRRFATECIAVSRFDLRSRAEPTKGGVPQIGAVGRMTCTAVNRDRYWCACIDALARFAFYSGIGAGTTRGYGQARLLDADQEGESASLRGTP